MIAAANLPAASTACVKTTWHSPKAGDYHPTCHWPSLCASRGCFWRALDSRGHARQAGLEL